MPVVISVAAGSAGGARVSGAGAAPNPANESGADAGGV
jgi:hypothetical protein